MIDFKVEKVEQVYINEYYFVQDSSESLVVIGRYISENYDGAALHPIDFINISTGQLVAEVMDPNITTISPVNKLHPREDILASGSSRFEQWSYLCVLCGDNRQVVNVLFWLFVAYGCHFAYIELYYDCSLLNNNKLTLSLIEIFLLFEAC